MSLSLIIAIICISLILIMAPLIINKKAENKSKSLGEWDKIKENEKKINEKTRNKNN